MKFSFTKQNLSKIERILKKYPPNHKASAVLALLDLAQRQNQGWLNPEAIETVAMLLEMPEIRVFEVATFYNMFNLKPVGKYHIQVCGTTPCMLCGSEDILKTCKNELGINAGQTTEDALFSLTEVECIGACINAPALKINDDFYENLSPELIKKIIQKLKRSKNPKVNTKANSQCEKAPTC